MQLLATRLRRCRKTPSLRLSPRGPGQRARDTCRAPRRIESLLLCVLPLGSNWTRPNEDAVAFGSTGLVHALDGERSLRLELPGAEPVVLVLDSLDADVDLVLESLSGEEIARDRDSGIETNARLVYRPGEPCVLRVRILAPEVEGGSVRVLALRLLESQAVPEPQPSAQAYWQQAWSRAIARDDVTRADLALEHLTSLEPGTAREIIEEQLFDAKERGETLLALVAEAEAASTGGERERARGVVRSMLSSLSAPPNPAADALRFEALQRAFVVAHDVSEVPAMQAFSERTYAFASRALAADDPDAMVALFRRGIALRRSAQLAAARPLLELAYFRFGATLAGEHENVRLARSELAASLAQTGAFELAKPLFEQSYAESQRALPPNDDRLLIARLHLATVSAATGDAATALALGETLLAWADTLPEDDERCLDLWTALAGAQRSLGHYHEAREYAERVARAQAKLSGPLSPQFLMRNENLASLRHLDGDGAGAREILEPTVAALERTLGDDEALLVQARFNLAVLRRELGDLDGARALLEKITPALQGIEDLALTTKVRSEHFQTLVALGAVQFQSAVLGDLARSLEAHHGRAAHLSLREGAALRGALAGELGVLLSFLPDTDSGFVTRALALIEGARASQLGSAARRNVIADSAELRALAARVAAEREAAARAAGGLRDFGSHPGLLQALIGASGERDAAERDLAAALARNGAPLPQFSAPALARKLRPDQAAVSFARYSAVVLDAAAPGRTQRRDEFLAFVLAADGTVRAARLGPAEEIEARIEAWRRALGQPLEQDPADTRVAGSTRGIGATRAASTSDASATGQRLRAGILDPVTAVLSPAVHSLVLCLDDVLNLVPLDALPYRDGLFGDAFVLQVVPCLGQLLFEESRTDSAKSALLVGGIAFGSSPNDPDALPALPGADLELEAVRAQMVSLPGIEPEVLRGAAATKSAFVNAAPRARFVHVATHGYAQHAGSEELSGLLPLSLCGLAFAGATRAGEPDDSFLSGEELAGLDLHRAELVVLSACDTHSGARRAGQALQSLDTAVAIAGARASLTSLWSVDDAAARSLMSEFYRRRLQLRESGAQALWEAKRVLRDRNVPLADWAGWTLSGAERP